jgi:PAS domain S-box-containing protein
VFKECDLMAHQHPFIKTYFFRYFLPLILVSFTLLIISWYSLYQAEKKVFEGGERKSTDAVVMMLTNEVWRVISDLNWLAQSHELQEAFLETPELHLKKLANDFRIFSIEKGMYDQIRLLDESGTEVVRVNYNNGSPVIVPHDKLQSKHKRYYFQDAIKLSKNEISISPMDLNVEHGQIETPLKPMLRFATPVFDNHGKKRGIILLNYFGSHLLEKLSFVSRGNNVELMLVNMEGYWLKGVTPEQEWGFMFRDRKNVTFSRKYTDAWQQISRQDAGQFSTEDGLFTFATIQHLGNSQQSGAGSLTPHGKSAGQLEQHAYMWKVVSRVPSKLLVEHPNTMQRYILPPFLAFFIVLAILAFKLAKSQSLRTVAEQRLQEANKTLEQKVTERTRELKEVNRVLHEEVELFNQSQKDLKIFENRCQNILKAIGDGIIGVDHHGKAIFINNAALEKLEYHEDEVLHQSIHLLIHHSTVDGKAIPEDDCPILATIRDDTPFFDNKTTFWKKGGVAFPVEFTCSPVHDSERVGAVIVFRDITRRLQNEQKQQEVEAQLYHTQKMEAIGTLAGGIAHDFNNILSAILGYTDLSLFKIEKESELAANMEQVKNAGLRAKDLVAQILAFSRGSDTKYIQVELTSIIKEVLKLLRSSLPSTIDIHKSLESTHNHIMADPIQMHQVLMNLGTNALHAMKEHGGTLTVELLSIELDDQACSVLPDVQPGLFEKLIISDTGCGMDADTLERVFDPFFTTKEEGEGTGLGLSTVHGIVKNCGGNITVTSEPGQGTTFTILFPVCSDTDFKIDRKNESPVSRGTEHILFVDDEETLVSSMAKILEHYGYKVTGQTDSGQALKLFREAPDTFDLVITDYTMPKMTGRELTLAILDIRPDMPVIICTGFTEMLNAQSARKLGAREFLMKPLTGRLIASAIRKVLDNE